MLIASTARLFGGLGIFARLTIARRLLPLVRLLPLGLVRLLIVVLRFVFLGLITGLRLIALLITVLRLVTIVGLFARVLLRLLRIGLSIGLLIIGLLLILRRLFPLFLLAMLFNLAERIGWIALRINPLTGPLFACLAILVAWLRLSFTRVLVVTRLLLPLATLFARVLFVTLGTVLGLVSFALFCLVALGVSQACPLQGRCLARLVADCLERPPQSRSGRPLVPELG